MSVQANEAAFGRSFPPAGIGGEQFGSDFPIVSCACGICALAGGGEADAGDGMGSARTHVSTNLFRGANDARHYAVLTQFQNADGSWSFSGDRNVDAVLIGTKITSTNLTYVFPAEPADYGPYYDAGQSKQLLAFNQLQRQAVRDGFDMIEGYTNLTFREVSAGEARDERATFRFGQTKSESVGSAMGNFPHSPDPQAPDAQNPSGDIWFGRTQQPYYTNPERGNWGYVTILHEIGHTMGLKHGGDDYTTLDFKDYFDLDSSLFGTRSLEWKNDGQLWSLMTYSTAPNSRNIFNGDQENQATSFMMYDIAALQYLYGANYNTQSGNTVYRWDPTTGENFINGVGQGRPAGNKVLETIWDGGGNDTYDLSDYENGVSVDLRPGATSALSQEQLPVAHAYTDLEVFTFTGSIGNALLHNGDARSLIENAIGGAGDDRLIGNQADNLLVGGDGDDFFEGMSGSDTIVGGAGADTASFSAATSGISVALNDGAFAIRVVNGDDVDVLSGIEGIGGTRFDDVLAGDAGDNMLAGGAGGNDVLVGNDGNDRLIGAGFDLSHRDLPDIVKPRTLVNNSRANAVSVDGSFDLAERYGVEQATTIPHATVLGTTAATGVEYYSFTAKAGATVMLDIDLPEGGQLYLGIMLVNDVDRIIGSNFAAARRDEGSKLASDPFVTATIPADGTYYAIVTRAVESGGTTVAGNLPAGVGYTLHLSVEGAETPEPTLVRTGSAMLDGGSGDDLMVMTMGDDTVTGGSGVDTVSFERSYKGIAFDLRDIGVQDTGAGMDRVSGVENVVGTRQADRIVGDDGDNVIDGHAGRDTLVGGAGNDTLSFARQARGITYDLAGQSAVQTVRLGQIVEASGFENLTGSAHADALHGDDGANLIHGGAGDDLLSGDSRGRVGGVDTLIGGDGRDIASFASFEADLTARLGSGVVLAGDRMIAELRGIERLEGGRGDDTLEGDGDANDLHGGEGDDILTGMAGDDVLEGGAGDDLIDGGAGRDTAVFAGAIDTRVDLRLAEAQETGHGRDTLRGIENLRLGTGNNIAIGDAGANVFFDGGGSDTIDGGDGVDTVDYSALRARVDVNLALTASQTTGGAGSDRLAGIENLVGGDFRNRFQGTAEANRFVGGAAQDTLVGGDGQDTLIGGDGNDVLVGDFLTSGADTSPVNRGDYLDGGKGWDTLAGGLGNDTLLGGSGNDTIVSGAATVTLFPGTVAFSAGITGDGGNDVIDGGDGIDSAILTFRGRGEMVALDLSAERAINILYSGGIAVGSVTSIERLTYWGGDSGNNIVGTSGYDSLFGGSDKDTLIGGLGDDQLTGGHGDDHIDGGEGHDIVNFSTNVSNVTRGITLDLRITTAQDTGQGMDTVLNVEQVVATRFGDRIIGGNENLTVIDSLGGDDAYVGNGGNDTLSVIRFASYATASTITLDGGDGEDTLNFLGGMLPDRQTADAQLPNRDVVTAIGGTGNDFITIRGVKAGVIDAGDGNDIVGISIAGTRDTAYDITLGAGSDELAIQWGNREIASFDRNAIVVRDFQAGLGGDLLGLTAIVGQGLFTPAGTAENIGKASPFLTGHVTLVKQGGDTILQADKDGRFGASPMVTVMKLENTNAFDLVLGNVYAYVIENSVQSTIFYDPIITQFMSSGRDRLEGHGGRDSLQGAAGDDLLLSLAGDDFLNGFAGNDTLIGGTGVDYMVGGVGHDVYYVDNAGDMVIEGADEGVDLVRTEVDWTLGAYVENIETLGGAIRASGNAGANRLTGSADGQETLVGLGGDDTYVVRNVSTTIVEAADGGLDRVVVAARSYTLAQAVAVEMMEAATGSDAIDLTGNEFDQMLVANAGLNSFDGGAGFDIVSYRNASAGVRVDGRAMRGVTGDAAGDTYRNVEAFEGSNHADWLLAGNDGSWLHGRDGDDRLISGSGNDNMLGGAGNDVFAFDTIDVSGRDRILDWGVGDRLATSKQLRGADSSGLVTIGTSGLLLLDGTARGDTAEMVDQGGAVLRAMGRTEGYWWYAYVSGADAEFDGRVTELAAVDVPGHAMGLGTADASGHGGMTPASAVPTNSPFYLYNAMGDAMAGGTVLFV